MIITHTLTHKGSYLNAVQVEVIFNPTLSRATDFYLTVLKEENGQIVISVETPYMECSIDEITMINNAMQHAVNIANEFDYCLEKYKR